MLNCSVSIFCMPNHRRNGCNFRIFFSVSAATVHIRILHNIFSSSVNFTIFRQYFLLKSLNNLSYSDIQSTDWLAFSYDFDALKEKLSLYWPYWALVTLKMRPFLVPTVCRIGYHPTGWTMNSCKKNKDWSTAWWIRATMYMIIIIIIYYYYQN